MKLITTYDPGVLKRCTFALLMLFAAGVFAQDQVSLMKGEKVKKENNLYGIIYNNVWTVPCKYEKLEAYAWNYLFAYTGDEVDVYSNAMVKKELLQEKLPIRYLEQYKSFANKGNNPLYAQGKWGFKNQFYKIQPMYDSIYVICMENSADHEANWRCDNVIGVVLNGKTGAVKNDGKEIALHPEYVSCTSRFTGGPDGRHQVICTHKKGFEVVYDLFYPAKNEFIPITGKNNLAGYVFKGEIVDPVYTAVNIVDLKIADYECILPDGKVEYRKGVELIPAVKVSEYKEKIAKEAQARKEEEIRKQQAKELAAKTGLTQEIKTKTHTFNIYPGWSGIFKDSEKADWLLRSSFGSKGPAEIFKEAPVGFLKEASYIPAIQIIFKEGEASTLENTRQNFIDLAVRRCALPKDKIKPLEEQLTLPDGRKGLVLFYVCADANGMIAGNYLDCKLSVASDKSPQHLSVYTLFMEGVPDLPQKDYAAWKDYFKHVLMSIRPNL